MWHLPLPIDISSQNTIRHTSILVFLKIILRNQPRSAAIIRLRNRTERLAMLGKRWKARRRHGSILWRDGFRQLWWILFNLRRYIGHLYGICDCCFYGQFSHDIQWNFDISSLLWLLLVRHLFYCSGLPLCSQATGKCCANRRTMGNIPCLITPGNSHRLIRHELFSTAIQIDAL